MGIGPGNLQRDMVPDETISNQASGSTFGKFDATFGGTATVRINLATNATLELRVTPSGGSEVSGGFFDEFTTLTAGNGYTYEFPITAGASYGFRVGTTQVGDLEIAISARLV